MKTLVPILLIAALGLALASGIYSYTEIQELKQQVTELRQELYDAADDLRSLHLPAERGQVVLYFIYPTETDFLLTPVVRSVPTEPSPLVAVKELLRGPLPHEGDLERSVPAGTILLGLEIEDGLANANFSPELRDNFTGGAQLESHLISAIVNTLTEFEEISEVQILIDGQKVESIGGHMVIDRPLSRTRQ